MKPKKDDLEPILNSGETSLSAPEPVCSILRRHRKQTGQDLKTVAQALRIRYVYLEAIEQGRYDALPGSTYALGFIKTYAEYLDLDEEEIVQRFRDDVDGLDDQTQLVFPSPVPEGKVPGGAILIVALVMGSLAYGGWYGLSSRDSSLVDFIPALPDRLMALFDDKAPGAAPETGMAETGMAETGMAETQAAATEPATATETESAESPSAESTATENTSAVATTADVSTQAAAPATTESIAPTASPPASEVAPAPQTARNSVSTVSLAQSQTSAPAAVSSAPSGTTVISSLSVTNQTATGDALSEQPATAQPEASTEIPAAPAAPVPTQTVSVPDATQPQIYGEDNADARIILRATQDAWVQVRDGSDELLLTRVLREGDVYRVPNEQGLTLLTGNAGGIEVLVDGTLMAPLGPVGSVRRDLALDPQVLLAGTAQQ